MILSGYGRMTRDLDIMFADDAVNLEALGGVLTDLDARLRGVEDEVPFVADARTLRGIQLLTLETSLGWLDVHRIVPGVAGFERLRRNAERVTIGDFAGPALQAHRHQHARKRSPRSRHHEAARIQEHQRHPERAEDVQLVQMPEAVRTEAKHQAGDDRRVPSRCEIAHEEGGGETAKREREQKDDVVEHDRVARRQIDRQSRQRRPDEMLRIRQRARRREELIGVPDGRPICRQEVSRVPVERPRHELGITGPLILVAPLARNCTRNPRRHWPRESDRHARKQQ